MKQVSLGLNLSTKKTRKREFLEQMDKVVPWAVLVGVVECQWSSNNPQLWHLNFPHPSHARSIRWSRNSNA